MLRLIILNTNETIYDGDVIKVILFNKEIGTLEFEDGCENHILIIQETIAYELSNNIKQDLKINEGIAYISHNFVNILIK